MNLTVADGFKFGCGLILASAFALVFLLLLAAVAVFAASVVGIPLPFRPGI